MRRKRSDTDTLLHLLHQHQPLQLCMSSDGKHVLAVVRWCDLDADRVAHALVLVHVATGRRQLLTQAAQNDTQPSWTRDGRGVVLVSESAGQSDLWLLHLGDGRRERLTDIGGSVQCPQVSPDGKSVAFLHAPPLPPRPGPQVLEWSRRDTAGAEHAARGFGWVQLWLLDLRTRRRRLTPARGDVTAFAWAPDGRRIAYVVQPDPMVPETAELWSTTTAGGARRRRVGRQPGPKRALAWSPDRERIAYLGHAGAPGAVEALRLWSQPARGGKPVDLLKGKDLHAAAAGFDGTDTCTPPLWSADGKRLFFLASREGSVNVFAVPASGGRAIPQTSGQHTLTGLTSNARGNLWALLREDATHPADIYIAVAPNGSAAQRSVTLRRLTRLHGTAARATQPQEFHVEASQGHRIHGFLLRGGRRRGPALLVLHGGTGAMAGWSFQPELQLLAAAGYHVFCANLRGSAGYGRNHLRALSGRWGVEDLADVHAVADWIEARPFVAPRRLALLGNGDGGFLTHWMIGHTARFRCAITTGGASHLAALYGTGCTAARLRAEFGVPPWEAHERYWRTSPLAFVEHLRTPLLILQGENDRRCPPSQAQELYTALAQLGRDVEMLRFRDADQDFPRLGRPRSRRERLRRILDWLARKL